MHLRIAGSERRNHEEIRFWSDYLVGDRGKRGGCPVVALVMVLGDLDTICHGADHRLSCGDRAIALFKH